MQIRAVQTLNTTEQDTILWLLESSKIFTVKSAYKGMKNLPAIATNIHRIWKFKIPPRIKVFAWLTYYDRILTTDNLAKRGWHLPGMCYLCRNASESVIHLFSECSFMLEFYSLVEQRIGKNKHNWRGILQKEEAHRWIVKKGGPKEDKELIVLAMFVGWRERCTRVFRDLTKTQMILLHEVQDMWSMYH